MIDIVQWRSSIGSWSGCNKSKRVVQSSSANCSISLTTVTTVLVYCCIMVFLTVVVPVNTFLLLILSGDVETNPGPLTVRQLDKALKKLVSWRRFAIYLPGIDSSDVQKIASMSISVDDQKLQLYELWLSKYPSADFKDVVEALKEIKEYSLADEIEQGYIEPPSKIPRYSLENTSLATKIYPLTPIDAHSYLPRRKTSDFDIQPPSKIARNSLEIHSSQTHPLAHLLAPDDIDLCLPTQKISNLPFPHPYHSMQHQTVTTWSPQYHNPAQYQVNATSSSGGTVSSSARDLIQTPEKSQSNVASSIQPTHTDQCNVAATVVLSVTLDVLRKFLSDLVLSISDPLLLANDLYSGSLITFNQKDGIITSFGTRYDKASLLMNDVDKYFQTDITPEDREDKFKNLCKVLRKQGNAASSLVDEMISELQVINEKHG